MKVLGDLNNERFLAEAFDPERNLVLLKAARLRRNIYLGLVIAAIVCIIIAGLANLMLLSVLSLLLALLSLVVMSKYNTQICFLRTIQRRKQPAEAGDEHEAPMRLMAGNRLPPAQGASL